MFASHVILIIKTSLVYTRLIYTSFKFVSFTEINVEDSKQPLKLGIELFKYSDAAMGGQNLELLLQRIAYWSKRHYEDEKKPQTYVFF